MTKVTTVTEYDTENGYNISITNDQGFSGNLSVSGDEAKINLVYPDGEVHNWKEHIDDAFAQLLANFFDR